MSMYEMVFGDGDAGIGWLGALGFSHTTDVGRYRSAWLEQPVGEEPRIAVYTRNGGGNRDEYSSVFAELAQHEHYLSDRDDEFDSTYATIYFSLPTILIEEMDEAVPDWRERVQPQVDTSARWGAAIDAIGTP